MSNAKPVPEGFHTVSAHLVVSDIGAAAEFYEKAFGGEELVRMAGPGGMIFHSEVKIGDSIIMLGAEQGEGGPRSPKTLGGSPVTLNIYTEDADALFDRAIEAGATSKMPVTDMFWGDRYGQVEDPFGHAWSIATHVEDLTEEEIGKRAEAFFAKQHGA